MTGRPLFLLKGNGVMDIAKTATVLAELQNLGTADNVAQRLREAGVKGLQGANFSCPITRYLDQSAPGNRHSTAGSWIRLLDAYPGESLGDQDHRFPLAEGSPVREFVRLFDAGLFSDLVEV